MFTESEESNSEAGSHAVVFDMNEKMLSVCREKAKDFRLDKREFNFNIKYQSIVINYKVAFFSDVYAFT